jgi:imidazoleglycerol-phosphate dehydratase / histidinol-phosphatase
MKKALFIDRDGTLVIEPPIDFQLDSLEKLEFYPNVFRYLGRIAEELDYELVMVTNQDGLGTASFPSESFWPAQNKIIQAFKNEGINFNAIHIDGSLPSENSVNRKPRTGMLSQYLEGDYDLASSFVIGDRITDVQLAENLGCKAIFMNKDSLEKKSPSLVLQTTEWKEVYTYLALGLRTAIVERTTSETAINIQLNIDGTGKSNIHTGLPFFDHMLEQLAKHGLVDLSIQVNGDLHIDEHHTIEDTALALGKAFKLALGNKIGITRYGFLLPMDDCLAQVAIDFGGRPWLIWDASFKREKIGDMPTEMFMHFFKSFSDAAECNLNIKAEGENEHHKIEAIFKGFAKAIRYAVARDINRQILPSTKGTL